MLLLMQPRMRLAFWAASAHCWLMLSFSITNTPQDIFIRTALNPLFAQPVFVLGTAVTQLQDLALGPVELYEVCMGGPLKPVQVPVDDIPSFQCVDRSTQPGVISKLAEGAVNLTIHVADIDVKLISF
ncbi:hypothetical protein llap_10552 [Limosa lapponica baueri]|uniref:Uncharacterized protein n=1 Tax=Limosa lapponica baueri TaxID=1758121 RepID=A0A2I0TZC7_LIMLA|nr:hypothetical protein llap_10552 [Limosa lapponica baueri]